MLKENTHIYVGQSVYRLVAGWMVRGSNGSSSDIFRTLPDQPWSQPSLLYDGHRFSIPGVKRPGRGVERPPPNLTPKFKKIQIYLYSFCGPSWAAIVWTIPLPLPFIHISMVPILCLSRCIDSTRFISLASFSPIRYSTKSLKLFTVNTFPSILPTPHRSNNYSWYDVTK